MDSQMFLHQMSEKVWSCFQLREDQVCQWEGLKALLQEGEREDQACQWEGLKAWLQEGAETPLSKQLNCVTHFLGEPARLSSSPFQWLMILWANFTFHHFYIPTEIHIRISFLKCVFSGLNSILAELNCPCSICPFSICPCSICPCSLSPVLPAPDPCSICPYPIGPWSICPCSICP